MSDREFHFRIERQPQLPFILAFPFLLVIVGVVVSVFNAVSQIPADLFVFIAVLVVTWFVYGRRKHITGRSLHGVSVTLVAAFLSLTAYKVENWYKKSVQAQAAAVEAKRYQERYQELAAQWEIDAEKSCREGTATLKLGRKVEWRNLDDCKSYLTQAQISDVCRPLILKRALPQYGWRTCNEIADLKQPNQIR